MGQYWLIKPHVLKNVGFFIITKEEQMRILTCARACSDFTITSNSNATVYLYVSILGPFDQPSSVNIGSMTEDGILSMSNNVENLPVTDPGKTIFSAELVNYSSSDVSFSIDNPVRYVAVEF
jgi:hypothetical protein